MESLFIISSTKERKYFEEIDKLIEKFPDLKFETHPEPPPECGGNFTVLHGLVVIVGGLFLENIFADAYEFLKQKLYSMYKIFSKDVVNRARVLNFVLHNDSITLMFVFELELPFNEYDKRYSAMRENYKTYFEIASQKGKSNRPYVFLWNKNNEKWELDNSPVA